jgi:predicted TIM-barrel fold metal-dependent hydrolase
LILTTTFDSFPSHSIMGGLLLSTGTNPARLSAADLQPQMRQAGVDRSILVQTQHDARENDWALSLADENDFIAGLYFGSI